MRLFIYSVKEEILGDNYLKERLYFDVTIGPDCVFNTKVLRESLLISNSLSERVCELPANLVIELHRDPFSMLLLEENGVREPP